MGRKRCIFAPPYQPSRTALPYPNECEKAQTTTVADGPRQNTGHIDLTLSGRCGGHAQSWRDFAGKGRCAAVQAGHGHRHRGVRQRFGRLLHDTKDLRQLPNHLRLTTLLFSGAVDALITERSVFDETLKNLPPEAEPSQQVQIYQLFRPVHPRIHFRDEDSRDGFDAAWMIVTLKEDEAQ